MEEKESTLSGSSGNTDSGGSPMPISSVVNMSVSMSIDNNLGVSCSGAGSAPAAGFLDGTGGGGGSTGVLGSVVGGSGSGGMSGVFAGVSGGGGSGGGGGGDLTMSKKKRGRPRKYDLDGNLRPGYSQAPVMSPPPGFTLTPSIYSSSSSSKRGRGKSAASGNWQVLASLGEVFASTAGGDFTPHIVTVQTGEDVSAKILSFSQKGPRGICVLSANGAVSNVTLRQPGSAGGIMTYEGRLEIVSLTGSFTVSETAGMRSRSGGLSVTLAGPDGRVIGGGIAGLLTAASPIQIVVGTFMPNGHKTQKRKYHREPAAATAAATAATPVLDPAAATAAPPCSQAPPYHEANPPSASPSPMQAQHDAESDQGPGSRQNLNVVSHYGIDWNGSQNVLGQKMYPDINMSAPAE